MGVLSLLPCSFSVLSCVPFGYTGTTGCWARRSHVRTWPRRLHITQKSWTWSNNHMSCCAVSLREGGEYSFTACNYGFITVTTWLFFKGCVCVCVWIEGYVDVELSKEWITTQILSVHQPVPIPSPPHNTTLTFHWTARIPSSHSIHLVWGDLGSITWLRPGQSEHCIPCPMQVCEHGAIRACLRRGSRQKETEAGEEEGKEASEWARHKEKKRESEREKSQASVTFMPLD